jgi:basic membrane protein A
VPAAEAALDRAVKFNPVSADARFELAEICKFGSNMKKLLSVILALALVLGMSAVALADDTFELALVTDIGTIDDKSFNQGAWEGLVQYAEENNISHKYYQPSEKTTEAYLDAIALAVEGGAKVIVTPGFLFEEPIFIAQDAYPEVSFILIDGEPHSGDYAEYRTNANVAPILR